MAEDIVDVQSAVSLATCYSACDLRRLFDDSLMARHISSPLQSCDSDSDTAVARKLMEHEYLDRLAIRQDGIIVGYVELHDLKEGKCASYCKRFDYTEVVAHTTPLVDILPMIRHKPALFLLEHTVITSIVTKADLQKPPVRMLLFGVFTLLEMYLRDMMRVCYPDESLRAHLTPGRLAYAEKILLERRNSGEDLYLADCLQMCDEYGLLLKTDGFIEHFRLPTKRDATDFFVAAEKLRNKLAHAQDLVSGTVWENILDIAERTNGFLNHYDATRHDFRKRFGRSAWHDRT